MHLRSSIVRVCLANYFMKFDVTYTGRRSLKGRGHPGLNRSSFDLQSKALPLNYIPVQVAPWLLQNSKHPHFPIFFFHFFFFALVPAVQQALTIFCRIGGSVVEFSPATELYPRASCSMPPPKFKAPIFPHFFSFYFRVRGCSPISLNYLLSHWWFSGRILVCHAGDRGLFPANAFTI